MMFRLVAIGTGAIATALVGLVAKRLLRRATAVPLPDLPAATPRPALRKKARGPKLDLATPNGECFFHPLP